VDVVTEVAVVAGILAVVAIVGFALFRASATTEIRVPGGARIRFGGSAETRVPTLAEDIKAGGNVIVSDDGGIGAVGRRIEAEGSVGVTHQASGGGSSSGLPLPKV
jgi:hypothetical protein